MNKVVPLYRSQMRALHRLQLEEPTAHMVLHAILRLMGSHTARRGAISLCSAYRTASLRFHLHTPARFVES